MSGGQNPMGPIGNLFDLNDPDDISGAFAGGVTFSPQNSPQKLVADDAVESGDEDDLGLGNLFLSPQGPILPLQKPTKKSKKPVSPAAAGAASFAPSPFVPGLSQLDTAGASESDATIIRRKNKNKKEQEKAKRVLEAGQKNPRVARYAARKVGLDDIPEQPKPVLPFDRMRHKHGKAEESKRVLEAADPCKEDVLKDESKKATRNVVRMALHPDFENEASRTRLVRNIWNQMYTKIMRPNVQLVDFSQLNLLFLLILARLSYSSVTNSHDINYANPDRYLDVTFNALARKLMFLYARDFRLNGRKKIFHTMIQADGADAANLLMTVDNEFVGAIDHAQPYVFDDISFGSNVYAVIAATKMWEMNQDNALTPDESQNIRNLKLAIGNYAAGIDGPEAVSNYIGPVKDDFGARVVKAIELWSEIGDRRRRERVLGGNDDDEERRPRRHKDGDKKNKRDHGELAREVLKRRPRN